MYCLWCNQPMNPELNWSKLLFLSKPTNLCQTCEKQLQWITGNRCSQCSRVSDALLCDDCQRWAQKFDQDDVLNRNYSVFAYNETIKEMVAKWKYRGDYILGNIFKHYFYRTYRQQLSSLHKQMIAVPIPLSEQRLQERGFNQAKMLADFIPLQQAELLSRMHGEKQSKKTRKERLSAENPFNLTKRVNKPVLLVDDIYTTGTTLRHAAGLLKQNGCPGVFALTLIRG
ncbi:ComF family protein [Lentibacillus sp. N15]|uniref:ComF family protein n=1 Tax=Lentibacillus songyuanensis TaxID=3136161 RepID=UPI0031B9BDAE